MGEYVLQMRNIVKSFYGNTVLNNVDFDLKRGHVHAIVGGNGAGKSTLMKILTGVYTKDSGEITIDGIRCDFSNYNDANAAGVRMIFQELSVVPTLTVTENIFLNHEYKKGMFLDDKKMKEEAEALLRRFDLEVPVDEKICNLSVGLCQLIEIVKALSRQAKVLVMDEPTASLTANEVTRLFDIVHNLKASGVSIVYISHRMNEILSIADEITVLRDGSHIITEDAKNLTINGIINYMLGESARHSFEYHERPRRENPPVMLEVENLCVDNLVKDVSFSVNEGEITGIAGLMGSGRTEILEALFGIRKIQKGSVKIQGRPTPIKNTRDAINAGIALVPEDRRREGLVLLHTVKINMLIALFRRVTGKVLIDDAKIKNLTRISVEELNIKTHGIDSLINSLSGGNQQKVVIAKWLKNDPKLLLLDEPTAGIDIGAKGEIIKIIEDYAQKGNSVIVVSSEIPELMAMCDKIIVMVDGRLTRVLTRNDMLSEEVIQHAIQG
ncbi:MAG: sugar ABC transporter ATP-binding protein [Spirochaetaceae bacterium]|jgi:ribose transport system ATP-binding protein|nr:sugar ABC transporter ATP-binding protein [Spirochaetaceae bacterium]